MKDANIDPKQKAILDAAWSAFATYGYRKTSMDDIARGAGMSRAALYLHYRNKEDIFRSLVQFCYDMVSDTLAEVLAQEGPVGEVLENAFIAQGEIMVAPMLNSAHGMELLDAGTTTAADLVDEGEARLRAIYAEWLSALAAEGRITLPRPTDETAELFTSAHKGAKVTSKTYEDYRKKVTLFAAVLGEGLSR